ncbi:MAG: tRNA preQ1(34) S-adenosylmethionine ribosyltransferase-isomerase QueA [Isosphaeraceae bacterium]
MLDETDLLVRNVTKVVPARLLGIREETGGRWEGLFLRALENGTWEILSKTRGKPKGGETILVGDRDPVRLTMLENQGDGRWTVRPESPERTDLILERIGKVPLPPYIRKGRETADDRTRYQTVYASEPGAVAAPTAGLHFTNDVLNRLAMRGIETIDCTLHVGIGTFRPIEAEKIEDHVMHAEWGELKSEAVERLNDGRERGGRVVAIGTTSVRVLESAAGVDGSFQPFRGETSIYLRPGHVFRGVDALLTNFHLPRSSLLVLISAFAGVDLIRAAYQEAIRERYRFYSYGDAMLIV